MSNFLSDPITKAIFKVIANPFLLAAGFGYLGYRILGNDKKYKYIAPIGGAVGGYIAGNAIQKKANEEIATNSSTNDKSANQNQISGYERMLQKKNRNLVSFDFGRKQLPEVTQTRMDEDLESMGSYGGDEHNYSSSYANNTYDNESEKAMNKFLGERGLKVIGQ